MLWFASLLLFGLGIAATMKAGKLKGLLRGLVLVVALVAGVMGGWFTLLLVSSL